MIHRNTCVTGFLEQDAILSGRTGKDSDFKEPLEAFEICFTINCTEDYIEDYTTGEITKRSARIRVSLWTAYPNDKYFLPFFKKNKAVTLEGRIEVCSYTEEDTGQIVFGLMLHCNYIALNFYLPPVLETSQAYYDKIIVPGETPEQKKRREKAFKDWLKDMTEFSKKIGG
jgi:hypothetical protein